MMRAPSIPPANINKCDRPILELTPSGDPALLYRTLARVLVRSELIFATSIRPQNDCERDEAA